MHLKMSNFSQQLKLPMSDLGLSDTKQHCSVHPLYFANSSDIRASHNSRSQPSFQSSEDADALAEVFEQFSEYLKSTDQ